METGCKRGCMRATDPSSMASSIKKWCQFLREVVLPPAAVAEPAAVVADPPSAAPPAAAPAPPEPSAEVEVLDDEIPVYEKRKYETLKRKMRVDIQAALPKRMKVGQREWGRYQLHQRVNLHEVPFSLDKNPDHSFFAETDCNKQISGPPGADKRFGTLEAYKYPMDLVLLFWWSLGTRTRTHSSPSLQQDWPLGAHTRTHSSPSLQQDWPLGTQYIYYNIIIIYPNNIQIRVKCQDVFPRAHKGVLRALYFGDDT